MATMPSKFIKQLKLGTDNYELIAGFLNDGKGGAKDWSDVEALVTAGFTIEAPWTKTDYESTTAPTAAKLATVPAVTVYYNNGQSSATGTLAASTAETRRHIYLIYHPHGGKDNFDEYVSTGADWEKIGNTDIDLSDYVKKGTYAGTAASAGAHTHSVSATGSINTVELESKKLAVSRTTDVAIGASSTKNALGENAAFTTTVTPSTKNIKATASGVAISGDASAAALTGVKVSATDNVLGEATTLTVTGGTYSGATPASHAADSFTANVPTTPASIDVTKFSGGSLTDGSVTGGVYSGATQASFTQGTFTPNEPTVIDVTKFSKGTQASFTRGAFTQGSLPQYTQGTKAAWSASVDDNGVLSFSFTANGDDTWDAGTLPTHAADSFTANTLPDLQDGFYTAGTAASHTADSFTKNNVGSVSPIVYTKQTLTPAAIQDGFYTAGVKGSAASFTQGEFIPNSVGTVSAVNVAINKDDVVAAATAVGANGTDTFLKSVKVTAQPTVALAESATTGTGIVTLVDGITSASTTATTKDAVAAITGVQVTAQPVVALDGAAASGVDYAALTATTGTETVSVTGTAASDGAHTHTTSVTL